MATDPRQRRRGAADTESSRIDWLRELVARDAPRALSLGIGDDAAVWRPPAGREVVLSIDAQACGTHFREEWSTARAIGRRAVHASVSDLAAMAARPAAILVSLLLPAGWPERSFRELVRGIDEAARELGAAIAGGNTSRGPLSVTITAIGSVARGRALRRDRLRAGDELWVTGCPGLAGLGLRLTEERARSSRVSARPRGTENEHRAIQAWKEPRARVREAMAIAARFAPRAAIDLSDGLARDLEHLIEASARRGRRVAIEIDRDLLERLEPLATLCRERGEDTASVALCGGEDYELCFTVPPGCIRPPARREFARRFGTPLTRLGGVVDGSGLSLRDETGTQRVDVRGFEHF